MSSSSPVAAHRLSADPALASTHAQYAPEEYICQFSTAHTSGQYCSSQPATIRGTRNRIKGATQRIQRPTKGRERLCFVAALSVLTGPLPLPHDSPLSRSPAWSHDGGRRTPCVSAEQRFHVPPPAAMPCPSKSRKSDYRTPDMLPRMLRFCAFFRIWVRTILCPLFPSAEPIE